MGGSDQDHPQEKETEKGKNVCLTRTYNEMKRSESQRRKGKIYTFECRIPKKTRRDKKAFLSDQCKEIEENNRLEISSRKLEIPREYFMQRWLSKGHKWYGPNRSRRY